MRFILKVIFLSALCVVVFGPIGYFAYHLLVKPEEALKHAETSPLASAPPDPTIPAFEAAMKLEADGKLHEAQSALADFVANDPYSTKFEDAKVALGDLNVRLFFSNEGTFGKKEYVVERGDAIVKILRKTKMSMEMLMQLNHLADPRRLRIGQTLWITEAEFSLTINSKTQRMTLWTNDKFFKEYKPLVWTVPVSKKPAPLHGKIEAVLAWNNGRNIPYGKADYADCPRWITTSLHGYNFFTQSGSHVPMGVSPPAGLGFDQHEMTELSVLLTRGDSVTVEQ